MNLRPYPRHKPSGIDWLGQVPEHWRTLPLRRTFRIINGGTPPSHDDASWNGDIRWVTPDDLGKVREKVIADGARTISVEGLQNSGARLVPASSIILSTRAPIGHVAIAANELCTNQGCRCLVAKAPASSDYFYYALVASRGVLQSAGKGTTFLELAASGLAAHYVAVPPLAEQVAIAEYLDATCWQLDLLVAKKRTLIEKLQEKRIALISQTVTRGLPPEAARAAGFNPHPRLRPSGVEWIGDVPEHWSIHQLKRAITFQRGHDLPVDERIDGGFPVVSSSGISGNHFEARAKGPGIVTGRYGTIGQFYLTWSDYWPLNTTLYTIDIHRNNIRFLRYMLMHLASLFMLEAVKSAVPGVDRNDIHPIMTAIPNVGEQQAIADYLDVEAAKIDRMIGKVEEAIDRLQEYRVMLITAAVTGKIDLREAIPMSEPAMLVAAG